MAVMQNSLVFGGVNSADYGIYISGEGVFNAPKRDVEMIAIPGRNGAFALDKGRFENITVTYPAFTYETTMAAFKQNLANFRNALSAQRGYQRLTDTFHTDEYRMASFNDGIEIKPIKYNTASEFTITFDCKPQRWLTSGEEAVTVSSGDTLTNPTLFESSPLLEVYGEGNIVVNGGNISVMENPYGMIQVAPPVASQNWYISFNIDDSLLLTGDSIILSGFKLSAAFIANAGYTVNSFRPRTGYATNATGYVSGLSAAAQFDPVTLVYGTEYSDWDANLHQFGLTIEYTYGGQQYARFGSLAIQIKYDGATQIIIKALVNNLDEALTLQEQYTSSSAITANSTQIIPSNPLYIDLEIGEAWIEYGGATRSANNAVMLEANLPILSPGANEITYDNTITELKVTPRWWKV